MMGAGSLTGNVAMQVKKILRGDLNVWGQRMFRRLPRRTLQVLYFCLLTVLTPCSLVCTVVWLKLITGNELSFIWATFVMLVVVLVLYCFLANLVSLINEVLWLRGRERLRNWIRFACLAIPASFAWTLIWIVLGHLLNPTTLPGAELDVLRRVPVLVFNAVFDISSVAATIFVLGVAVGPNKRLSVLVAILADVAIAAALACVGLWCALNSVGWSINLPQTVNVLLFRSLDAQRFDPGPLCLMMHTTFLITAIYLARLLVCWGAKILYVPANKLFILATGKDAKPELMAAALIASIGRLFGFMGSEKGIALCARVLRGAWRGLTRPDTQANFATFCVFLVVCAAAVTADAWFHCKIAKTAKLKRL